MQPWVQWGAMLPVMFAGWFFQSGLSRLLLGCRRFLRWSLRCTFVAALTLLPGCVKHLPNTPSELTEGIIIYQWPDYGGANALVTSDVRDLSQYRGPSCYPLSSAHWGDCIQSIKLAPGWHATVFEDDNFKGDSMAVASDVPDLGKIRRGSDSWANCISSIRVSRQ